MPERSPRQPRKPFQNSGRKKIVKKSAGSSRQSAVGGQRSAVGGQRSAVGGQRSAVGGQRAVRRNDEGSSDSRRKFIKADDREGGAGKRPYRKKMAGDAYPKRSERRTEDGDRPKRVIKRSFEGEERPKRPAAGGRPRGGTTSDRRQEDRVEKKPVKRFDKEYKPRESRDSDRPGSKRRPRVNPEENERPKRRAGTSKVEGESRPVRSLSPNKYPKRRGVTFKPNAEKDGIRLNKYIANSGICSRREADELIQAGVIKVNDVVVTTLGSKVMPGDKVQYEDQTISNETKRYLILNKQKGYVTTTKDPHAKNTVMELIEGACKERIYPVGRLDRNTTGVLLFTNDGELAKKLMHPSSRIKKMYHVVLDQPVSKADVLKIAGGIFLDDEKVIIDSIAYVEDAKDRREIGMELHSGQNRVVRRIFESLGYKVTKLDRVVYAGLTKKGIPRGKWRFLNEREVIQLKMLK